MPRPATGKDALQRARESLAKASTADALRVAQAVVLPLDLGLSVSQTAKLIGRSTSWVVHQRRKFIKGEWKQGSGQGGRRNQAFAEGDEVDLVKLAAVRAWFDRDSSVRQKLRALLDERTDPPVADSTMDRLLARVAPLLVAGGVAADLDDVHYGVRHRWAWDLKKRRGWS